MADLLIRDVPDDVLAVIDARARRLGLSRTEFLRRQLASITDQGSVTLEDLDRFSELAADLGDPEVMAKAWE